MSIVAPSIVAEANGGTASEKVDAIRRKVIEVAALPLAHAATLPREAYTDEDYFAFERRTVRNDRKPSPIPAITACLMVSLLGISITIGGLMPTSANRRSMLWRVPEPFSLTTNS